MLRLGDHPLNIHDVRQRGAIFVRDGETVPVWSGNTCVSLFQLSAPLVARDGTLVKKSSPPWKHCSPVCVDTCTISYGRIYA